MVLLCLMLDLRTISPPLLKELKQCLLQLANQYAISTGGRGDKQSEILTDRIGLCYLQRSRISCFDELKIAYSPRGDFCLRDFHHAVNNLPVDGFLPEMMNSSVTRISDGDVTFGKLLSDEVLYSWGGKDIDRKVICVSSCLVEGIESARETLADAADKCVSVEFILLEQESCQPISMSEDVQKFSNSISDLENCSFRTYLPDARILCGLVKRWHQELKDDFEEPLQAVFHFKNSLVGSMDKIFCNLVASMSPIIDGFSTCETCRCHGLPLDGSGGNKMKKSSVCPLTRQDLGTCNLIETAVRVGEQTILFLPSFQNCPNLQQISAPISFTVIERTKLCSLSEGVIFGSSYMVTPSACHEMEDKSELNAQSFQGLCGVLHSLDQGLICSSNCNLETKRYATFQCFYFLQPSEKGPMLLRRLAGSEEILPFPDATGLIDYAVPLEVENSIRSSLLRMELRDYNPLLHERGFHPKLNLLVKESLHFGSIPQPKRKEIDSELILPRPESLDTIAAVSTPQPKRNEIDSEVILPKQESSDTMAAVSTPMITVDVPDCSWQQTQITEIEDLTAACITEEWEQLIVDEEGKIYAPKGVSRPKTKTSTILSPMNGCKQLDEKTSRILERLEGPRRGKGKENSPIEKYSFGLTDACAPKKKPLVPFGPNHATQDHQSQNSSQPMKPIFQRLKRKDRSEYKVPKAIPGATSAVKDISTAKLKTKDYLHTRCEVKDYGVLDLFCIDLVTAVKEILQIVILLQLLLLINVKISNTYGELYSLGIRNPQFKWIQDLSKFDKLLMITPGNNGWISIGSLDGFLYSFSPSRVLRKLPKANVLDSVVLVSQLLDCSGYAIYFPQTVMEGKISRTIGDFTYISAMKPKNVVFTMLVPATGSVYWSGTYTGQFTSFLNESNLQHFRMDERILLAFVTAGNKGNPLSCRTTRQKLTSSCSLAKSKHLSLYTGNERTILLFLLFESLVLIILVSVVRFCCIFWRKEKLKDQNLRKLEQKATAEEALTHDVREKLGVLVKERYGIEWKLSTTYSLGRDKCKSISKSILPLYNDKTKSFSFKKGTSDYSCSNIISGGSFSSSSSHVSSREDQAMNFVYYEDKESGLKEKNKLESDEVGPSNTSASGKFKEKYWESSAVVTPGFTHPLYVDGEKGGGSSSKSNWLKRRTLSSTN
ncbi:hypothetical protein MKX01_008727 [Papaver californicum]|nr:hypothetical protein MKX01_008727 [Papaver californicum]